jgi:hypothetical protein
MTQGWIRVWIPRTLQEIGVWVISVGGSSGKPAELIAAPGMECAVLIEGIAAVAAVYFAISLKIKVNVEFDRVTEIHIPDFGLLKHLGISAPLSPQSGAETRN